MSDTRVPPTTTLVRVPVHDAGWTSPDDAYGSTVAPSSDDPSPPPLDDAGTRYAARGALGEGGMGVVQLVMDRRIGRDVAMKTMRLDRTATGLLPRFVREACVQGQLEHPSIVPVYDLGVDAAGVPYFTMKRVHGITLEEIVTRLRRGDAESLQKYGRRRLLTAFASVCQAVEFAHARGVLHRDLKPSNVMLGDFGEVYVLDWGVAKVITAKEDLGRSTITPPAGSATNTIVGVAMGTPGYMAPEQARGDANLDERADVYALGAILFEVLCLEPLQRLHGMAAIAASQTELDARPSTRAPNAMIPPELDDVCARAAAFQREARYAAVRDMLDALERFLDGDRDTERRRELAQEHAAAASEAAETALKRGPEATDARRRALREAGHALALDAENASAAATLMRLLTEPPSEVPSDALADLHAASAATQRATARGALLGYLAWFAFVPFGFWMGVRSVRLAFVSALFWALAAGSAHLALRRAGISHGARATAIAMTAVAASLTCMVAGPYVLVPTLAVINVMLWLLVSSRSWRPAVIGLGVATILAPAALDLTHVVRFYNFRDGRVTILQGMLDFHPVATHALFLAASIALVAVTAILITRFRDNLDDAERRLHVQAWQLKHVVPYKRR